MIVLVINVSKLYQQKFPHRAKCYVKFSTGFSIKSILCNRHIFVSYIFLKNKVQKLFQNGSYSVYCYVQILFNLLTKLFVPKILPFFGILDVFNSIYIVSVDIFSGHCLPIFLLVCYRLQGKILHSIRKQSDIFESLPPFKV